MGNVFLQDFLKISDFKTVIFLAVLFALFAVMQIMAKKKVSFAKRVLIATGIGLVLGLVIQAVAGFPTKPTDFTFINETTTWYSLFGNGFIDLIRMLVVPLVMVSIMHVIINMKEDANIGKLTKNTLIITMTMVAVSVCVGLFIGIIFNLGAGGEVEEGTAKIKTVTSIVGTLRGLLPSNPAKAMVEVNIIALVIMAAFFGIAAKRMKKKYFEIVKPFYDFINALQKIIISVAMSIIKFMPFAVIPLLANTIAMRGITSILEVGKFIIALYLAAIIMFVIQLIAITLFGYSPVYYLKKSLSVMILAFTSRSSVGTLPMTIDTLINKLGVNDGTASFVAGFGTTAGMQGCAGFFPALLIVYVSNMSGTPIDFTLLIMSVIVISVGSLGIAGIPGTATMAASVALSGTGMAAFFPLISPILAIDPIIDMARTMLNVTGALTNSLMVDKTMGLIDMKKYKDMKAGIGVEEVTLD